MSRARLNRVRRRRRERRFRGRALVAALLLVPVLVIAALVGAVTVAAFEYERFRAGCELADHRPHPIGRSSFVYAADDSFLGTIPSTVNRQLVEGSRMSPWIKRATVAIEDRRFYEHDGVDYQAVARAALRNLRQGEVVEGASTLTQQLVRNLYLSNERTFARKKEEACLALALDGAWSKQRILSTYLNRVFYGNRAYGIEAAAQTYFGRRAYALGPAQAALLAGLVRAPTLYDPFRRPATALARRNLVLDAMIATGALTRQRADRLKAQPLGLKRGRLYDTRRQRTFFDLVRRQLVAAYGEARVRGGGLRVYTTLSPRLQRLAREAARSVLGEPGDPATAVVAVDPRNGAVRALLSRAPGRSLDFNLAVQGRRQAGSSFKTFVLAEAIRRGANPFTTTYDSSEFEYDPGPGQELWRPKTYSGETYGRSTLTQATLRSDNLVYAKLTLDLGPASVARMAERLGVRSQLDPVASIGLGANGVTVLDMASAYATLAANGLHREPYAIRKVVLPSGDRDEAAFTRAQPERVLADGAAHHVTRILEQNVLRGTGTAAQLGRPVAGKTGTTDEHTDAWFVGYVPQLATAVWVGYPARTKRMLDVHGVQVTGGSFPAQIWADFMRPALAGAPVVEWREPTTPVDWQPWRGERASGGNDDAPDVELEEE
jgi:penicillin-binding protein 1A